MTSFFTVSTMFAWSPKTGGVFVNGNVAKLWFVAGVGGAESSLCLVVFSQRVGSGDTPTAAIRIFQGVTSFFINPADKICAPRFHNTLAVFGAGWLRLKFCFSLTPQCRSVFLKAQRRQCWGKPPRLVQAPSYCRKPAISGKGRHQQDISSSPNLTHMLLGSAT